MDLLNRAIPGKWWKLMGLRMDGRTPHLAWEYSNPCTTMGAPQPPRPDRASHPTLQNELKRDAKPQIFAEQVQSRLVLYRPWRRSCWRPHRLCCRHIHARRALCSGNHEVLLSTPKFQSSVKMTIANPNRKT